MLTRDNSAPARSNLDYAAAIIPYLKSLNSEKKELITGDVLLDVKDNQYRIVIVESFTADEFSRAIEKLGIRITIKYEIPPSNNAVITLTEAQYKRLKQQLNAFLDEKEAAKEKARQPAEAAPENKYAQTQINTIGFVPVSAFNPTPMGLISHRRNSSSSSNRPSRAPDSSNALKRSTTAVPAAPASHQGPAECKPIGLIIGVTAGLILLAVCATHPIIALYLLKQCLPTAFTSTLAPTTATGAAIGGSGLAVTSSVGALFDCCFFRRKKRKTNQAPPAFAQKTTSALDKRT